MGALDSKRLSNLIFAALFVVALALFYRIVLPFFIPVVLGAFAVVLFTPVHHFLSRRLPGRPSICAAVSTAAVAGVFLVPLVFLGYLVGRELLGVVDFIQRHLETHDLGAELIAKLPLALQKYIQPDSAIEQLEGEISGILSGGASLLGNLLGAGTQLALDAFLTVIAVYYFFLDGRRLLSLCCELLPLDGRYVQAFVREFQGVAHAMVYGQALIGALQGAVGFMGFWIAGVPNAALWSCAMAICAFVPVGGTLLVWVPVGVARLLAHQYGAGMFVFGWGILVIGSLDSLLRPKVCAARMALHPLLVFLSIFGGVAVFGAAGLLVGPLIASIFMAMVRIYRRDFLARLPLNPSVALGTASFPGGRSVPDASIHRP